MNINELREYKRAAIEFVDFDAWQSPVALTLTYEKAIWPEPYYWIAIDEYAAEQNLHHFLNVLNRRLLCRSDCRKGIRIGTYAVFEEHDDANPDNPRPHCHAMIECPDPAFATSLPELVERLWRKTTWGYRNTKVRTCYDDGWLDYCEKFRTKFDYASSHDWLAFTPPTKKVS